MRMVIQTLPINRIKVLNPRSRNPKVFNQLVASIAAVGLKRPITVTKSEILDGEQWYGLLCGEGRLTACQELGEEYIPCHIVEVSGDEGFLISLAENIARRKHTNLEILSAIRVLYERGYSEKDISRKIGLHQAYIRGILHLLREGEVRLIAGVEKGYLPIDVAVDISRAKEKEVQTALSDLYQQQKLKRGDIAKIRRLIQQRKRDGKTYHFTPRRNTPINKEKLLQMYENEIKRRQLMATQAEFCQQQLLIILFGLNRLFEDNHFKTLLRAERIVDMPENLSKCLNHYRETYINESA